MEGSKAKSVAIRFFGFLLLACVAFGPILRSGFVSDDFNLIHSVASKGPFGFFTFPPTDYFRPLISLTVWLDYHLYGLNPVGYHVTNLLVHTANSLLVASLATTLYARVRPERSALFGLAIGAIYCVL